MGILGRLFGRRKAQTSAGDNLDVRSDLMATVDNAICTIMITNITMMGMDPQTVPTTGSTGSLRSRGYLLGLTETVMQQFGELNPTQDEFMNAFASAFAVTYGACDWGWALDTIDLFQAEDPDVLSGARLARRDVLSAYSGQPFNTTTGFWLLNNGDEQAIAYNLSILD